MINDEKPAFDFAQMILTTIAWWTILLFTATAIFSRGATMAMLITVPTLAVGALFGIFLAYRINLLTERVSAVLEAGASSFVIWLRWPLRAVIILMPPACAFLIVWALMFAPLP